MKHDLQNFTPTIIKCQWFLHTLWHTMNSKRSSGRFITWLWASVGHCNTRPREKRVHTHHHPVCYQFCTTGIAEGDSYLSYFTCHFSFLHCYVKKMLLLYVIILQKLQIWVVSTFDENQRIVILFSLYRRCTGKGLKRLRNKIQMKRGYFMMGRYIYF